MPDCMSDILKKLSCAVSMCCSSLDLSWDEGETYGADDVGERRDLQQGYH